VRVTDKQTLLYYYNVLVFGVLGERVIPHGNPHTCHDISLAIFPAMKPNTPKALNQEVQKLFKI
jgi:hypothetical protein